jgi:glycosyltransferase involved in cell wall biosynthesis
MYHADLVGGLVARWAGIRSVIWGIRNSSLDADKASFTARAVARTCALLSRIVPSRIVCCSVEAAEAHQRIGYQARKFSVIPNGYDLSRFAPDAEARTRLRQELGIEPQEVVLGMVARWDPVKDHATLLRALARLRQRGAVLRCVLVGTGMTPGNAALTELLCRLGIEDDVLLAGPREDIPAVMNALDLHVLSSAGEAFPNVVAEAMACGTPCVATNVGDTALIVGDAGWVVPRQSAVALADGIEGALAAFDSRDRVLLSRTCRRRIQENFSLEKMVGAYLALWEQVTLRDDLRG